MIFSLWKKFKEPILKKANQESKELSQKDPTSSIDPTLTADASHPESKDVSIGHDASNVDDSNFSKMETIAAAFQQNEIETLEKEKTFSDLSELKKLVEQPKEQKLEMRFSQIDQHITSPVCHETLRQELWPVEIHCPSCRSTNLKRVAQLPPQKQENHRYHCLDCDTAFNDDSGTAMGHAMPTLNVWMHCWYLMGCTESLSYIAKKLGLEISMVEFMALQLQKTFQAKQPLTRFIGYTEWSKQSQHMRNQLKEDLMRDYERLNANIATVPKDTAEHRRQTILRRELKPSIAPPNGGGRKR